MMRKVNSYVIRLHIYLCIFFLFTLGGCKSIKPQPEERAYPVTIAAVEQRDVSISIESIGNVFSLQIVQIRPQVGGVITHAYVEQGQYVKKDDPLYQIEARPFKDRLDVAKATLTKDTASLKFAQIRVERYSDLVKKDYFSKLNFDQYTTEVEAAKGQKMIDEANVALAELDLEWTTIMSPIEGKISQFNVDPGNLVVANDPKALTDIRQITPADIRFNLTQKDFIAVQKAKDEGTLKFEVFLPQKVEEPRSGQIYFIDNHFDLSTGTILIKGSVENNDELFWPGEFVRVRLNLGTISKASLVPEEAVQVGQDGPFVYVYIPEKERVEYRLITKGEKVGQQVVIEKGITSAEKVVTKGQVNLRPGSKVKIITSTNDKAE
ncbi:MAG: efflux RND transporter periplasmic adaptor subunit [Parachlamydiaceae bacterium]|nr:efflux RND transporter periplasmic adaptor subunit [Parachlamydiaceae bacterium]